jgi:hypothetical protein
MARTSTILGGLALLIAAACKEKDIVEPSVEDTKPTYNITALGQVRGFCYNGNNQFLGLAKRDSTKIHVVDPQTPSGPQTQISEAYWSCNLQTVPTDTTFKRKLIVHTPRKMASTNGEAGFQAWVRDPTQFYMAELRGGYMCFSDVQAECERTRVPQAITTSSFRDVNFPLKTYTLPSQ